MLLRLRPVPRGGGKAKRWGSGEEEEAREGGLLSTEAFVREGVGGSAEEQSDWYSVSLLCLGREAGEGGGGGEEGVGESRRGKKAKRGLGRWVGG